MPRIHVFIFFDGSLIQSNRPLNILFNTVHATCKYQCHILHQPHMCDFVDAPFKLIYRLLPSCARPFTPDAICTARLSNRETDIYAILRCHRCHVRILIFTTLFLFSDSSVSFHSLSRIFGQQGAQTYHSGNFYYTLVCSDSKPFSNIIIATTS